MVRERLSIKDGNPIPNADINIEIQPDGKTIKTDSNGRFTIDGIPDGNYRIVIKYDNGDSITTVTESVRVKGNNVTLPNISLKGANLNSKVEIGENAPDIVVSGLNDLFGSDKYVSDIEKEKAKQSGNNAEIKFVVSDLGKIKQLNEYALDNKKQIGSYLDFSLFKIMTVNGTVTKSYLSSLDNNIKIIIPLSADMQGKKNYVVYRIHNGQMQEIKTGLENANELGEYLELSEDGKVMTVHTRNFSSYAIAFDKQVPVSDGCFIHWIILAVILAFIILITLFTLLFNKKCPANIITWGCFAVAIFVLTFFVWKCAADIALWIVGVMLAILTALIYFFAGKKTEDEKEEEEVPEIKEELASAEDEITAQSEELPPAPVIIEKTIEDWIAKERENAEESEDAHEYLTAEIAKEEKLSAKNKGTELRKQALNILINELDEEERIEKQRLTDLERERTIAKNLASEQNLSLPEIVTKELESETDEYRRSLLIILQKEFADEEADKKLLQTTEENDEPNENDLKAAEAEAEKNRQAYLSAKRGGAAVITPINFKLSREDVLDFVAKANIKFQNRTESVNDAFDKNFDESKAQLFPIEPNANLRKSDKGVDSMRAGVWCFAMMIERKDTIKFVARMDDSYAAELTKIHTGVKRSLFPKGDNWYDVIIDGSYLSKKEIFSILYHCYLFVLKRYYELVDGALVTDENMADLETKEVNNAFKANENSVDADFEAAIAERQAAEKAYLAKKSDLNMTRRRILRFVESSQGANAEIIERERLASPASLKINGKTYAMVYQGKTVVRMILKLDDDYADTLSIFHPLVRRAKFPKGANWFVIEVDSSYSTARQVYTLLTTSRNFVSQTKTNKN